jgi:hypothetical protein
MLKKELDRLNNTKPFDVFVSHKQTSGGTLAAHMKDMLMEVGKERGQEVNVFLDVDNLPESTMSQLEPTISRSNNVLLIISGDLFKSNWVAKEILWAEKYKCNIITLYDERTGEFPQPNDSHPLTEDWQKAWKIIGDIPAIIYHPDIHKIMAQIVYDKLIFL